MTQPWVHTRGSYEISTSSVSLNLMEMSSKKFNPFKDFQTDQLQRSSCKIFTAHYVCMNADLKHVSLQSRHILWCEWWYFFGGDECSPLSWMLKLIESWGKSKTDFKWGAGGFKIEKNEGRGGKNTLSFPPLLP